MLISSYNLQPRDFTAIGRYCQPLSIPSNSTPKIQEPLQTRLGHAADFARIHESAQGVRGDKASDMEGLEGSVERVS